MNNQNKKFSYFVEWHEAIAATDDRIHFINLEFRKGKDWWGAFHPNKKLHAVNAEQVTPVVKELMGW